MPKRSAQSKIERYERKIRRIQEKCRRIPYSSSDDEGNEDNGPPAGPDITTPEPTPPDSIQEAGSESIDLLPQVEDRPGPALQIENPVTSDLVLDPEILSALGESMSETPDYGDKIHDNLAKLWLPLLKKGITKGKDMILKDYPIPENCRLLQAPTLNAKISAAVPDMVRNRDKIIATSQQQLGAGITAINRGIDTLLKTDDKVQAMKHLSNGCRILCDSHHLVTQNRVKLVIPSLDKSVLHMINDVERDETLFGSSLSDKIKAAKAIEKQGLLIKKPNRNPKPAASQPISRPSTSNQGNWPAPPRYQTNRGRGTYRKPAPSGARRPYSAPAQQPPRPAYQDKSRPPAQTRH